MFKITLASLMLAGLCLQAQAQSFGNDVRHGPCVTGMGSELALGVSCRANLSGQDLIC